LTGSLEFATMDESSSPIKLPPEEPTAYIEGIEDHFMIASSSGSRSNTLPVTGGPGRIVPPGSSPSFFFPLAAIPALPKLN